MSKFEAYTMLSGKSFHNLLDSIEKSKLMWRQGSVSGNALLKFLECDQANECQIFRVLFIKNLCFSFFLVGFSNLFYLISISETLL